jgi:hypothetical protein
LAGVTRPSTRPPSCPISADRGRRIRNTGTRAVRCRREAVLGSNAPRNWGKSVVQLGPWNYFAPGSKTSQFKKFQFPKSTGLIINVPPAEHPNSDMFFIFKLGVKAPSSRPTNPANGGQAESRPRGLRSVTIGPSVHAGGSFLCLCRGSQSVGHAFLAKALGTSRQAIPLGPISMPTAVRTFFEGEEEYRSRLALHSGSPRTPTVGAVERSMVTPMCAPGR